MYFLTVLLPLLSGWIIIGNDTSSADIPFRKYSAFLLDYDDSPHWLAQNGAGIDYSTIYWVAWSEPLLSNILVSLFGWSLQTFAFENAIWTTVGFSGIYSLSNQILANKTRSNLVAFSFICSGVIKWASLSYVCFVAEMILPWILVAARRLLDARTQRERLFYSCVLSLFYFAIIRSGYPGLWATSPFFVCLYLLLFGDWNERTIVSIFSDLFLVIFMILILLSDVIYNSLINPIFTNAYMSRIDANMSDGMLNARDLLSLLFPLSPTSYYNNNVYFGLLIPTAFILLVALLLITIYRFLFSNIKIRLILCFSVLLIANVIANTQMETLQSLFISLSICLIFSLLRIYDISSLKLLSFHEYQRIFCVTSRKLLFLSLLIILVSSDNIFGIFIRHNIFPFTAIRYQNLFNGLGFSFLTCFSLLIINNVWLLRKKFKTAYLFILISIFFLINLYAGLKHTADSKLINMETFSPYFVLFFQTLTSVLFLIYFYSIIKYTKQFLITISLLSIIIIVMFPIFGKHYEYWGLAQRGNTDMFVPYNVLLNIACFGAATVALYASQKLANLLLNNIVIFTSILNFHVLYFQSSDFVKFPDIQEFNSLTNIYQASHFISATNIKNMSNIIIPKAGNPLLGNPDLLFTQSKEVENYWFLFNKTQNYSSTEDCSEDLNYALVTDILPSYIKANIYKINHVQFY